MIAELNDLQVKVADIMNAYVTDPVQEKTWTVIGPEFDEDQGNKALLFISFYGLKISEDLFFNHLADYKKHLGYYPFLADPDLWMKPMVRPDDGTL